MLEDVPKLAPGGHVTLRFMFPSPAAPRTYGLRIVIDNTPLREAGTGLGTTGGEDLYFAREIMLAGIDVR